MKTIKWIEITLIKKIIELEKLSETNSIMNALVILTMVSTTGFIL